MAGAPPAFARVPKPTRFLRRAKVLRLPATVVFAGLGGLSVAASAQDPGSRAPPAAGTIGRPRIVDDPASDGWLTEQFARRTDKTLKKWASHVSRNEPLDPGEIDHFVHESFACGELRPAPLERAYLDDAVTVWRPGAGAIEAARGDAHRGGAGFARALERLFEPAAGASSRRTAIKTIRVRADTTPPETFVRIEFFAAREGSVVQQVSHWTCRWSIGPGDDPGLLVGIDVEGFEEVEARATAGTLFADCTVHVLGGNECFEAQLLPGSEEWLERMDQRIGYDTRGHQGVAIGDVDGDGLDDVYVCQAGGLPNRLFLHQADGTARDVSAQAGVDWLETTHGALFVDFDGDGDQDLAVGTGFDVLLLANDGKGRFVRAGLLPLTRPTLSLAAADYDNDGDVDLYACVFHPDGADPGSLAHPIPLHDASNGGRNRLFRNDTRRGGDFFFTDVTAESGLDENNTRWSYAAAFEDYDNDGDQDLYVANDFGRNNLYRNDGGRFRDVAAQSGAEDRSFGMSAAWGDFNRDGWIDLHVGNMFSSAGNRVTYQRNFKPGIPREMAEAYQYLARGNSTFQNLGGGTFADVSVESNATMGRWAWSSLFLDANNDGWEDVFVCNGYLTNREPDDL